MIELSLSLTFANLQFRNCARIGLFSDHCFGRFPANLSVVNYRSQLGLIGDCGCRQLLTGAANGSYHGAAGCQIWVIRNKLGDSAVKGGDATSEAGDGALQVSPHARDYELPQPAVLGGEVVFELASTRYQLRQFVLL